MELLNGSGANERERKMLPLIVHSKLFFYYRGKIDGCWYLGWGDGTSVAKQNAYMDDMDKFGVNTITLNICNEDLSSPFKGEFMRSELDAAKVLSLLNFIRRLKERGKLVVIMLFDCPQSATAKYPFWRYMDRIPAFIEIVVKALAPLVDGFMLAIESNRGPLSIDMVEIGIDYIRKFAARDGIALPVGTHEQNVGRDMGKLVMRRRVPRNADFVGFETSNHPYDGDKVPVAQMVEEIQFLVANSGDIPVWVVESNASEGSHARAQNNAMAALPGVIGVNGVL